MKTKKAKAAPKHGIGSRDGGWGAADIADFLWHSRKLEIALGGAVSALRDISGAKAADDVPLYAKSFELLGRIQGIASVALDAISTPGCSVFEVVDATDDENYFTLGVFLSLADAMREVESCDAPDDLGGDHGDHEEYCVVEIRERKIGWGGIGRKAAEYRWESKYDGAADEYGWIRTPNAEAETSERSE